jgi:ubiquinone/menaquinone biosynthesis C-methylase UbiE
MTEAQIEFNDGAGYDAYMGPWSRDVGDDFIDWLNLGPGLSWLDVGCGSGAFTERVMKRCAPKLLDGVDPAKDQIDFAQKRADLRMARFRIGDAMALPYEDGAFDVAVMPLVIFFVPDPFKGVAEMARVVRPGGTVAAYGWDLKGGGFPYDAVKEVVTEMGFQVPMPPNPDAAQMDRLKTFWSAAGLEGIETRKIPVERSFSSPEDFWATVRKGPSIGSVLASMRSDQIADLESSVERRLRPDAAGRLVCRGWANAVRGLRRRT